MSTVIWHDLECGGYRQDLPLWRRLAAGAGGPILDLGAGTGRVSLALAADGHDVVAVDIDPELLAALADRAGELPVVVAAADVRELALGRRFPLILVPMQTVQLLGGAAGRSRFFNRAAAHLTPDGTLAIAVLDQIEEFSFREGDVGPLPDITEVDGTIFSSQPISVRRTRGGVRLVRRRETVTAGGDRASAEDRITLDLIDAAGLEAEARGAGLRPRARAVVDASVEHVGSDVVLLTPAHRAADG